MREHLSNGIRAAVFLLVLVLLLSSINGILMPKYTLKNNIWPTTSTYSQFYDMERDSVDVLFLGSSVVVNAFSPQKIYNTYGIRSYNLGSEQQSIFLSYYWLREALRYQSPSVVVLDTKFLFDGRADYVINTSEELTRKCLDSMKWSAVKREAVSVLCSLDPEQTEISYYLKNIRYHTRWSELKEYDIAEDAGSLSLMGFGPTSSYGAESYDTYTPGTDTQAKKEPDALSQQYLDQITALCSAAGIQLVLLSLPGNTMNDGIHNTLTAYAAANSLDYYNLCETELYHSIGAVLPRENLVGHENIWGAAKMSQFVGGLLADRYQVPSVSDAQYESTRDFYAHILKNCELVHMTDMREYLDAIADDSYTVFIAASDDASSGLTEEIKSRLSVLGLQSDLTGKFGWSYAAVISPENGVSESLTDSTASLSGSFRNKNTFYEIVSTNAAESTSTITIDGKNYCRNRRGLNFVIYDNALMKVIDKVNFDTYSDCSASR